MLHGFGFAEALAEIGLPDAEIPMALLTFNIGVEIGRLEIVAVAIALRAIITRFQENWLKPNSVVSAYCIGIMAHIGLSNA